MYLCPSHPRLLTGVKSLSRVFKQAERSRTSFPTDLPARAPTHPCSHRLCGSRTVKIRARPLPAGPCKQLHTVTPGLCEQPWADPAETLGRQMFAAALFIVVQTWERARRPFLGDGRTHSGPDSEYYSALETSEPSSAENTWRDFKCMLLGDRRPPENVT